MYLTGATNDGDEPALVAAGIGLMIQRGNSYHRRAGRYPFYAIDIGMGYSEADPYLEYVERQDPDRCLFAVSPDCYPDAVESQRRGLEFAPVIREMGFPVAIVAQDGAESLQWPWDEFDALFIGGERNANPRLEWKVSGAAERLVHAARRHGKWVHMGRVNSGKDYDSRLQRARQMGCNSADGTFLKYRKRQLATDTSNERESRGASELNDWMIWLRTHPVLFAHESPSLPVHKKAIESERVA